MSSVKFKIGDRVTNGQRFGEIVESDRLDPNHVVCVLWDHGFKGYFTEDGKLYVGKGRAILHHLTKLDKLLLE